MMNSEPNLNDREIGFYYDSGRLQLQYPKFLRITNGERKPDINEYYLFYRLFKRYEKDISKQKTVKEKGSIDIIGDDLDRQGKKRWLEIELFFSLLEDYNANGLLLFTQRDVNTRPKGGINWSRTQAFGRGFLRDNVILYDPVHYNNLNFNYYHPVTMVYACALLELSKLLDVKFNLPYSPQTLIEFKNANTIPAILSKFKREMYSDRSKRMFHVLEQLYAENRLIQYANINGPALKYAEKFDLIWEWMLKAVLRDQPEIRKEVPSGSYEMSSGKQALGARPKPDILVRKTYNNVNYLLVLDAKNYVPDPNTGENMPHTDDIIKQVFYRYFLSKEYNPQNQDSVVNIINAFILPRDLAAENAENPKILYFGRHNLITDRKNRDIGMILCFFVDFFALREAYLQPSSSLGDELLSFIIKTYEESKIS